MFGIGRCDSRTNIFLVISQRHLSNEKKEILLLLTLFSFYSLEHNKKEERNRLGEREREKKCEFLFRIIHLRREISSFFSKHIEFRAMQHNGCQ